MTGKKSPVLLALSLLICLHSLAQAPKYEDFIKKYSPLTPTAASLGKFGDVPVSLYTGVPNIQVPIYEINVRGFKLPINLSYHAGGVKVEDIASWVGLGWSLNAGGVINRIQHGMNDELMRIQMPSTYASDMDTISANPNSLASSTIYSNYLLAGFDLETDVFNYSFAGQSGKVFADVAGNFYTMPANKLKFSAGAFIDYSGTPDVFYGQWIVKDNEGVEYIFGKSKDYGEYPDSGYDEAAVEITRIMNNYDDVIPPVRKIRTSRVMMPGARLIHGT